MTQRIMYVCMHACITRFSNMFAIQLVAEFGAEEGSMQEDEPGRTLNFTRFEAFGIRAKDYTITCKSMPRAPQLASSMDQALAASDAVALADSLAPPPAQADSEAPLGKFSALKVAAICVGVAPLCCLPRVCMCCDGLHGI